MTTPQDVWPGEEAADQEKWPGEDESSPSTTFPSVENSGQSLGLPQEQYKNTVPGPRGPDLLEPYLWGPLQKAVEPLRPVFEGSKKIADEFWGFTGEDIQKDITEGGQWLYGDRLAAGLRTIDPTPNKSIAEGIGAIGRDYVAPGLGFVGKLGREELGDPLKAALWLMPPLVSGLVKGLRAPSEAVRLLPNIGAPPVKVYGPVGAIPPQATEALYNVVPRGGAYIAEEVLTEPGSRIASGQFSTGSGEGVFGEAAGTVPSSFKVDSPMGLPPKTIPSVGVLPEKLPTYELKPVPQEQLLREEQLRRQGIDLGTRGPSNTWIPPKEYTEPVIPSRWRQRWNAEKMRWGQEYPVLKTQPQSNVISGIEATHVFVEDMTFALANQPWVKGLIKMGDNTQIAPLEKKLVDMFKAGQDYLAAAPQELRMMFQRRDELFALENSIRAKYGYPAIPKTPGPYVPRTTDEEFKLFRTISRESHGGKVGESVGSFGQGREIETMQDGLRKGVTYRDWRESMLMREVEGYKLQATDLLITDLKKAGVIYSTKAEALAANKQAFNIPKDGGLPFAPEGGWWVRSNEERQFLLQNLRKMENVGDMRSWANQYIRNPSLVNPAPHILKNMGLKLMQQSFVGGLNPASVMQTTFAYRAMQLEKQLETGSAWNPLTYIRSAAKAVYPSSSRVDMLDEFHKVMPFTETGKTVWELVEKAGPQTMVQKLESVPQFLNGYSRRKIFAEWDPAMRYGIWREYVKKGMTPQEAANHAWIDLIRYGTRADRIDAWNSMPFNFFTPWRVGTLRTVNKALQTSPVRMGMVMGAVDILREYDARVNGRFTHLPWDYIERPLMTLMKEGKGEALQTLASTMLLGPGGDYALRTVKNIIDTVEGKGGEGTVRQIAWGLAMTYDLWPQYRAWEKDHNSSHIVDMMGLLLVGRHGIPYGAPHRFGELIPEDLIRTSPEVLKGEKRAKQMHKVADMNRKMRAARASKQAERPMQPFIPEE